MLNQKIPTPIAAFMALVLVSSASSVMGDNDPIQRKGMNGYLIVNNEQVPQTYNAGYSMYVAAWPLLKQYPGQSFQSGLFGTWMYARKDLPTPIELYSTIEGGLGWWRDTEFATETPKFIMGGVAPNFSKWANGPGAGNGRDWQQPGGKYGIAQLSPWLVWPPDGLNLKQGTCGELFGYGYLPLPLTPAKTNTAGKDIPTGDQSWTLFLNTRNFKGPVAFFTPYFWSAGIVAEPRFQGMLLDGSPTDSNRALQMETQDIPSAQAKDKKGETYARVAPTSFPLGINSYSVVAHRIYSYQKEALWDKVKTWFEGGPEASGVINPQAAMLHVFPGSSQSTWRIPTNQEPREGRSALAWTSFAKPVALDPNTFGFRWNYQIVTKTNSKDGPVVSLPEYFHLVTNKDNTTTWVPVRAAAIPPETGLTKVRFDPPANRKPLTYVTPEEKASCWKKPGPVAGPFKARLGDGSVLTYYWYRFADQPTLLNADLTDQEREALQLKVEKLHRLWKKDREYLPPPTIGKLAELDPALIVTPPAGFEAGYVPIATRQAANK